MQITRVPFPPDLAHYASYACLPRYGTYQTKLLILEGSISKDSKRFSVGCVFPPHFQCLSVSVKAFS